MGKICIEREDIAAKVVKLKLIIFCMRTPQSPPIIIPVIESIDQPFWSIMIPAYNCSEYLPETIESVLANDFGIDNIQIEVIDEF